MIPSTHMKSLNLISVRNGPGGQSYNYPQHKPSRGLTSSLKNARIVFYPKTQQVRIFGEENLTGYRYGHNSNRFCKNCGVTIDIRVIGPPDEEVQTWDKEKLEYRDKVLQMHPVTLRILDGVEWKDQPGDTDGGQDVPGKIKVNRIPGKDFPAPREDNFYFGPMDD